MPRPQKSRLVRRPPRFTRFKPAGIPIRKIDEIFITLDECEAIRFADYLGFDHTTAAEEMEISRSTFSRLIENARKKVSQMLIEGKSSGLAW